MQNGNELAEPQRPFKVTFAQPLAEAQPDSKVSRFVCSPAIQGHHDAHDTSLASAACLLRYWISVHVPLLPISASPLTPCHCCLFTKCPTSPSAWFFGDLCSSLFHTCTSGAFYKLLSLLCRCFFCCFAVCQEAQEEGCWRRGTRERGSSCCRTCATISDTTSRVLHPTRPWPLPPGQASRESSPLHTCTGQCLHLPLYMRFSVCSLTQLSPMY